VTPAFTGAGSFIPRVTIHADARNNLRLGPHALRLVNRYVAGLVPDESRSPKSGGLTPSILIDRTEHSTLSDA
jgi:hypothetical protein